MGVSASVSPVTAMPISAQPWRGSTAHRRRRGRAAYQAGRAAEASVAREYVRRGGQVDRERYRTPDGEIDLVIHQDDMVVFVEVKARVSQRPISVSKSVRKA